MRDRQQACDSFDTELCLIGGTDPADVLREATRLLAFLDHVPEAALEDIAYTCACSARQQPAILALVVSSVTDLRERLMLAQKKLAENPGRIRDKSGTYFFRDRLCPEGRIAFLFPGALSFYPDMLRDLNMLFDDCRMAFDELEEAIRPISETFIPSDFIFPPVACYRSVPHVFAADAFAESFIATHAANTALHRLIHRMGIVPEGVLGFSGGDLAALDVAGVFGNLTPAKRVELLREGYTMLTGLTEREDLPACRMLAVLEASPAQVESVLAQWPGRIEVTAFHGPRQQSIAVSPEIEQEVVAAIQKMGARTIPIPMSRPFNTPWCAKVLPTIQQFLSHWVRHMPKYSLYSCATADRISTRPREILKWTIDQWNGPIRFEETIRKMYDDGYRIFVEVGARGNLTLAIGDILKGSSHQAVALNRIHRSGLAQLHHALGVLAAQGVPMDVTPLHRHRRRRRLDFDHPVSAVIVPEPSLRLSAQLPVIKAFSPALEQLAPSVAMKTPIDAVRRGLPELRDKRRLSFGADFPMLVNAKILDEQPGILLEIAKDLSLTEYPFLADYAIGTTQLSFADPAMKGLTILSLISGLELMAEAARKLVPRSRVAQVDNLRAQRWLGFSNNLIQVIIRAERIAWSDVRYTALKVQLRDHSPNSAYTWPIMEATILLTTQTTAELPPAHPVPLTHPRQVNWSGQEIYPDRLFHGASLRVVKHVDQWSEEGIDFEIEVPTRSNAVQYTRIPLFSIWPQLLDGIVAGFSLWRSHEKFVGAVSLPFRVRRIIFHASGFTEGTRLRGYLRLTAVTPRSHVADIQISDGQGNLLIQFKGWEELCERVPVEYQRYIMRPSERMLSQELPLNLMGNPTSPVATAVVTDVPFKMFENNQEIWLQAIAHVLLAPSEREDWRDMQGTTARRMEWLFGRATAKEAVRRYLQKYQQSRWTSADIQIWADDSGKPHPIGPWRDLLKASHLDLSIAHTSRLIVSAVAANARVGIDIEVLGRDLTEDFIKGVFTHEEMELAAQTAEGPTGLLKFWCAKEAISKALGIGIRYSPRDLHIISVDPGFTSVQVELLGQWIEAFKQFKGRKNTVSTSVYAGHAFAACLFSNALFD